MISELLLAALPAVSMLAMVALALAVWVTAQVAVEVPRSRPVGGRARAHAVLLAQRPASSHPDAAGHTRSRAPGRVSRVA